ncbi:hypothetical protein [Halosimplex sp. TS25]|uniref:hypothetical protein n=1 Tax=Halosimplex rarum TaxID=3396619 RepID=UPI0039E9E8E1
MPVSFSGWVSALREGLTEDPRRAVLRGAYSTYLGLWYTVTSRVEPGRNVYERDWDALLVLDACRVDALRAVAPEYPFLDRGDIESVRSVACGSPEWLVKTFTEDHREAVADTAYVTASPFAEPVFEEGVYGPNLTVPFGWPRRNVLGDDDFADLVRVWPHARDERIGAVPPGAVTERAIVAGRATDAGRLVAQYAQPGTPALGRTDDGDDPTDETDAWSALRDGDVSRDLLWERYLDDLRYVLDEVTVLLENLDARTVAITADHGETFGEWGAYGHLDGLAIPQVKRVPWVETTATDTGWRTPTSDLERVSNG